MSFHEMSSYRFPDLVLIRPVVGGYIVTVGVRPGFSATPPHELIFSSWNEVIEYLKQSPCPTLEELDRENEELAGGVGVLAPGPRLVPPKRRS